MRHLTSFVAGIVGAAAFVTFQASLPPAPAWLDAYCADASPCVGQPSEAYNGLAFAIDWFESDGTPCPEPAANEHPQSACQSPGGAFIGHWVMLTRGDVHHGQTALDHDVFFIANSPIYGGSGPQLGIPSTQYAYGAVVAFGLPPTASAPQAPALPVLDPAAWQMWFDAAHAQCVTNGNCPAPGGSLTQAEFDALLSTSPFLNHVHDLDPGTITVGEAQVTTSTGR